MLWKTLFNDHPRLGVALVGLAAVCGLILAGDIGLRRW